MYTKLNRFGTNIHVYTFDPKEFVLTLTAEQNRTPLSKINHDWWEGKGKVCKAKVNAGFFGWSLLTDTSGVDYRDEGFTFSDTTDDDEFIELVYQDKKLHLFDGTVEDIKAKFPRAEWAISMGYSLVEFGRKSIRKADRFTHSYQKHPRTMIGQRKDGAILFAVTDDRGTGSAGLTVSEQASVMLELDAYVAVNADGGGSSELIVDNEIKNNIGADGERALATALLVYGDPLEDVGEPENETDDQIELKPEFPVVIGKVQIARNFTLDEIACRHCNEVKFVSYELIEVAQAVRDYFGKPIRLVGYRCPEHNKAIGGDDNSGHMYGKALDLSAWNNDIPPIDIYNFVKEFKEVEGLGIYSGHVHIDQHHNKRTTWDSR